MSESETLVRSLATLRPVRPMPFELAVLQAEASAKIQALEEAALRDQEQLHGAIQEIVVTAGVPVLLDFIEWPKPNPDETTAQAHFLLPDHCPISLLLERSSDGWAGRFWPVQASDPLAQPGSTQAIWRIERPGNVSYAIHIGTALHLAQLTDDERTNDEIPF